ncbi:hypothetical protein V3C99_015062 [Haemonchus contortus]
MEYVHYKRVFRMPNAEQTSGVQLAAIQGEHFVILFSKVGDQREARMPRKRLIYLSRETFVKNDVIVPCAGVVFGWCSKCFFSFIINTCSFRPKAFNTATKVDYIRLVSIRARYRVAALCISPCTTTFYHVPKLLD